MTLIKDWPKEDQPRHRITSLSPYEISVSELLAVLIGTGTREHNALELGMRIYEHFHHSVNDLSKASVQELMKIKGIGIVKAAAIVAVMELGKRQQNTPPPQRHFIKNSREAAEFVRPLISSQEWPLFGVLYFAQAGWVKDAGLINIPTPAAFLPHHQGIFRRALELYAVSFVTFETADDLRPGQQRIQDIEQLRKVAAGLDIKLLDHMILTKDQFFSFADEGRIC